MERRGIFGDRRVTERRETTLSTKGGERRSGDDRRADDRRGDLDDRRGRKDRRDRALREPVFGGRDRPRSPDWTAALPPIDRLIPAAVVLVISLVDLFVAQATSVSTSGLLIVAGGIPIAAFALRAPRRWRGHLAAVWLAVGVYLMAAGLHIAYLLTR